MAYRPPTHQPRTAWAVHLDAYMRKHGLSQTRAFELAQAPLGLSPKSRSGFLPFLIDREPSPDEAKALASVFGWPDPTPEPEPARIPQADILDALARMLLATTQALTDVRLELARARRDAEEQREATAGLIGGLSAQLDEIRGLVGSSSGSAEPG